MPMQKVNILNSREIKKLKERVERDFGYYLEEDYAFLKNEGDKVFVVSKDIARLDLNHLIIDKMGLYFAELKEDHVRLSKEGAQLLALEAAKQGKMLRNTVLLDETEVKDYFQGKDVAKDCGRENRSVLLYYKEHVLGCAKYKEGKILNFLPKIHRGEVIL
jgi:NOL1/NOP2/fmu family ribosome biogenesis protein